jgi:hypothetical protein
MSYRTIIDTLESSNPMNRPGYNGTFWTINLTQVLPDLSEGVSISGPGASALVVRRGAGGEFRIFNVGIVSLRDSTVSRNIAGSGGGIFNSGGTVNVTNSTISGNTAAQTGSVGGGRAA